MKAVLNQLKNINISSELRRGLEKESLRVSPEGYISEKPHMESLGSALTHPFITTDYSEALLEFVTPIYNDPKKMLTFLEELHIYTLKNMGNEVLWANSMPCLLKKEETIPIANYGSSNIGTMKSVYRKGLKARYGSAMQVISGIHFNFSLTDNFFEKYQEIKEDNSSLQNFKSARYMNATRNIHRFSWLIPFLFGSSPAICRSFLNKAPKDFGLQEFDDKGTLFFEGATSLRLSNLGYTNSSQNKIKICYNEIDSYAKGLREAITTPEPSYEKINGSDPSIFNQLNSNILQIENEYYSGVRPKRVTNSGESPTNALLKRGVEYIELRSVDVNPYSPIGIDLEQVLFLDVFLVYCILKDHDGLCEERTKRFRENQESVARHGRQKNLTLFNGTEEVSAITWAQECFEAFLEIAEKIDLERGNSEYSNAVLKFSKSIDDTSKLNSERILNEMQEKNKCFFSHTLSRSHKISDELRSAELDSQVEAELINEAKNSLQKQREIESSDKTNFSEFLDQYFKQNM
ncbi:MAG: glutamate--cysteine ligase [Halobacteriovorax sp.]|nr:glutamate--cysteine ligase [Halobacteriovorax sp.]|tara:strand:- start:74728 stop:76287 length:1560 start_codon:yes stop_codon:yes gene_type:complete